MKKSRCLSVMVIIGLFLMLLISCQKAAKGEEPGAQPEPEPVRKSAGLFPASINTIEGVKWGYIDKTDKLILKPVYERADEFQKNGLAVVQVGGAAGLIDVSGKYIVHPKYDYIDHFSEGLAVAYDQSGYKMIDQKGLILFESPGYIGPFQDERAVFAGSSEQGKGLYGYFDRRGKVVIEPIYESAGNFKNGKAVVKLKENEFAIIGRSGEILTKLNYYYVDDIGEGLLAFKEKEDGKFGFIDEKGNVVIKPKFSWTQPFRDGRAIVNVAEDTWQLKYGLIDKRGQYVIAPEYNDILALGEGMFAVGIPLRQDAPYMGSRYAIAGPDGKLLTDFIYYGVSGFQEGLASAYDNTITYFIDKTGKRVEGLPSVAGAGSLKLEEDLIKADVDRRVSYLDRAGNIIWKQNTDIPLNNRYTVREEKYRPNRNYLVYYPQIAGMDNKEIQEAVNRKLREMAITKKVDEKTEMDFSHTGDFLIEYYKKDLLVLEFSGYEYPFGAAHGMPVLEYAHIDLKTGKFYELKDLFRKNSNYDNRLSDIVREQIETLPEYDYVWQDEYKGIKEDQPFIITHNALKLYFHPYEIAPYAAGFPTFTIPYREIMDIINTEGSFWKAFHES